MNRFFVSTRVPANRVMSLIIFVVILALYLRTTAPTLGGGWDSEEFQHVAYTLGIAHSTGYPLYLLLGKIFTTLVPLNNIAYRMNLLSAIIGALTASVVYQNAWLLTQRQMSALATTALFATNVAVWRQAGVASVGPLNLLWLAAILYALLQWRKQRVPLTLTSFLFGLSLAHHRTTLFLLPTLLLFIWLTEPSLLHRPRAWMRHLFFLVAPLAFYLYLPLFGNDSPWYSNTLDAFINHVAGSEAGNYTRPFSELGPAFSQLLLYLYDSLGYLGLAFVSIGVGRVGLRQSPSNNVPIALLLGLGTLTYLGFATWVSGEQERYFVLPFAFLIYWFALGVSSVEDVLAKHREQFVSPFSGVRLGIAQMALAAVLGLFIAFPLPDRFRRADWSTFDRVYKTWDEIFTLPIPPNATIVGNWGQLNAMRYLQRIERRRTDLQLVGTQYDATPQTAAAQAAFADGRAIFLAPGIALPIGEYRYAQLGPLVEVRHAPQMQPPAILQDIALSSSLKLVNHTLTTALEPYAPTTRIAPNRTVRVTLDWHTTAPVHDFLVRLKLRDPENHVIAQTDEPPVRGLYAPSHWSPGEYVRDVHNLQIPAGTPPGTYTLKMQILDVPTQSPTSEEIVLGSFAVTRATNLTRAQVFIAHPLDLPLNNRIRLLGYGGFEGKLRAGENLSGNLIFLVQENHASDLTLRFELVDTSGVAVHRWERAPIDSYPAREWQRGEILKAYYDLPSSPALFPGDYTLRLYPPGIVLGRIQIAP